MRLRASGIVPESVVDGPGIRLVVFFQGCPHGCKGCHNPGTHDFAGGFSTSTEEVLSLLVKNPLTCGITLSGGEPFCQTRAARELAKGAALAGKNVWCYTGYTLERLLEREDARDALSYMDTLVDGPFMIFKKTLSLPFRGSSNQRIINLKEIF